MPTLFSQASKEISLISNQLKDHNRISSFSLGDSKGRICIDPLTTPKDGDPLHFQAIFFEQRLSW